MIRLIDVTGKLAIDYRARDWCKLPYPDHPKGCINVNNKPECPPQAPLIEDWIDLNRELSFIVAEFDLNEFALRMRVKHSQWSDRQCRCCLYWQNSVRKKIIDYCEDLKQRSPGLIYTLIPEAMGVNVFKTARRVNIPIKRKPDDIVYKIALMGHPQTVKYIDADELYYQLKDGLIVPICYYDGISHQRCINNRKYLGNEPHCCMHVAKELYLELHHEFDGMNCWKCPCG